MTTENIYIDDDARARCAAVALAESISEAAVYSNALVIGLNVYGDAVNTRVFGDGLAPPYRALVAADWVDEGSVTGANQSVTISTEPDAAALVTAIADTWSVSEDTVRSKCLCTGLAFAAGVEAYLGPYAEM
jgi:hypothetical protein